MYRSRIVMNKNLISQIEEFILTYPQFTFNKSKGRIEGEFELKNESTDLVLETYELEIFFSNRSFVSQFPQVYEISEKIPRIADRHMYENGMLCLATSLDEFINCSRGINLSYFTEKIIKPFLATQTLISLGEIDSFPQGEYSHGKKGILESYKEYFGLKSLDEAFLMLKALALKMGRNERCFCNGQKKYKQCHLKLIRGKPLPDIFKLRKDFDYVVSE